VPSGYVELIAKEPAAAEWLREAFRSCHRALAGECECEVVDEQYFEGTRQSSELVIRVTGEVAGERIKQKLHACIGISPAMGSVTFFEGRPVAVEPPASEIEVSYYRHPTKVNRRIVWVDSCVRLRHIPTGITARCQVSRSRDRNLAGAMELLKAKLDAAGEAQ
jgi:protein subunit release factor B